MHGIHGTRIAFPEARARFGGGGRGLDGDGDAWHRYRRLGPDTILALRHDRAQADLRPRQLRWRLSAVSFSGPCRGARQKRARRRPGTERDRRSGFSRSGQRSSVGSGYSQGLGENIRGIRVGCLRGFFAEDLSDEVKGGVEGRSDTCATSVRRWRNFPYP